MNPMCFASAHRHTILIDQGTSTMHGSHLLIYRISFTQSLKITNNDDLDLE